ncbi:hypothetical protein, partial [Agromyces humi]|uniref:hypothetical protein n=1 Tax=Agromyces humi TaxID=1766800 RepID=UPI00193A8288
RAADAAATAGDPPGAILSGEGQLDGGRRLRWLRVTVDPASPAGEVTATAAPAVTSWLASGLDDGMVLVACLPSRLAASRPASVPEALYVLGEEPCR